MKRLMLGALVTVVMMGATMSVAPVAVADEGDFSGCGYVDESMCGGSGNHAVPPTGAGVKGGHSSCMYCTSGQSADCHGSCALSQNPTQQRRYEALLDAGGRRDVAAILDLAQSLPGFAVFNADRDAIQLKDCKLGQIVANIPVGSKSRDIARAQLPSAVDGALHPAVQTAALSSQ